MLGDVKLGHVSGTKSWEFWNVKLMSLKRGVRTRILEAIKEV